MEKKVLVFVCPNSVISSPSRPNGGIEAHSRILIDKFKEKKMFVVALCLDEGINRVIEKKESGLIYIVLPLKKSLLGYLKIIFLLNSYIRKISKEYTNPKYIVQSVSYIILSFPKNILRKSYIFVHGIMFREYQPDLEFNINYLKKFLKWKLVTFLEYISYLNVKKIITINNEMKSLFPNKKVYTINNVPSKNRIKNSENTFFKEKIILCVGNIIQRKNQINLLRSFISIDNKSIENWQLLFVGRGKGIYLDYLKKLVLENKNVRLLDNVNDENLNKLFQKSYIFCLPSKRESSPISILEAMCFNCKIIAYETGGIPEMNICSKKDSFMIFKNNGEMKNSLEKMINSFENDNLGINFHDFKYLQERFDDQLNFLLKNIFNNY